MASIATFCKCPGDPEGCRQSLVLAWRKGSLGQHCMMEGLKANWPQCRQVLAEGLYNKTRAHKGFSESATASSKSNELGDACKAAVFLGYSLEIEPLQKVFHEAYYELVRTLIHKFGIKDTDIISADDVSQNVFTNLHKQFRKGAFVKGMLAGYIATVTIHECCRAKGSKWKQVNLTDEDQIKEEQPSSVKFVPPEVVENWEYFDHKLLNSDQGNLINRIILAQQCIEACSTGSKPSAKDLKAAWQNLKQMSEAAVDSLCQKTVRQIKQNPETDVAHIAAELLNSGLAEPCQVAIVFAAATGMNLEQTSKLLDQLNSL